MVIMFKKISHLNHINYNILFIFILKHNLIYKCIFINIYKSFRVISRLLSYLLK